MTEMYPKQFDIWLANLTNNKGAEPGKTRPVAIIQSNLLNNIHPTVVICPITSTVVSEISILRVHLKTKQLEKTSDISVDQIRAIDKSRLI